MPGKRVFIRTLGCPKNEADSELLRGLLQRGGYEAVADRDGADVVVVNTCAFIEAARRESVDAILEEVEARREGQTLVVTGCLVERYGPQLAGELPEVHAFVGLGAYPRVLEVVEAARAGARQLCLDPGKVPLDGLPRPRPASPVAFVKISEGCDRTCAFCAIPAIRGRHRSRSPEAIAHEVRTLTSQGVREVVLVAQDMSLYGRDAVGRWMLPELIRRLGAVEGLRWLRTLYHYPASVTEELLAAVAETEAAVPYFDLSLQHASARVLRRMRRWGDGERFLELIGRIRAAFPEVALRSAFIVGFPGETERDVEELAAFLREARLDWAGFFPFSREEGTEAAGLRPQVPPRMAQERAEGLAALQLELAEECRQGLVGREVEVLVEERRGASVVGRTWREAPEVDAVVTVSGARGARVGDMVRAVVAGREGLDLRARAL